jgi:hypothetical protein
MSELTETKKDHTAKGTNEQVTFQVSPEEYQVLERVLKAKKKELIENTKTATKAQTNKTMFVSYRIPEKHYKELEQIARSFFENGAIDRPTVSSLV